MAIKDEPLDYDQLVAAALDARHAIEVQQVYATLALAYQLRTANLIQAMPKQWGAVSPELRDRLGVLDD